MSRLGWLLCAFLCSGAANAKEYLIFKSIHQKLGIESLPHKFTVWHMDALDLVEIAVVGDHEQSPVERVALAQVQARLDAFGKARVEALFLMTYSAREKMHKYGLTNTPSAVLLDDDGSVLKRWFLIENGTDLYSVKEYAP